MIFRSKAPLRLGLAGGGTDVSPFCDRYGGAVINVAINMFAYCTIIPTDEGRIVLNAPDRGECLSFASEPQINTKCALPLHAGVYNRVIRDFNHGKPLSFRMTTYSDAPAGSGLGTSSTMVVAILKCFVEWLNLPLGDYDIASLAYQIERIDLGFSGGKQDQYAATFGGLNFMEFFEKDKVIVNPLRLKKWIANELENSIILFFTGTSRDSGQIIEEQKKSVSSSHQGALNAMMDLKENAFKMKESILRANFSGVGNALKEGWEAKKRTSSVIHNAKIDSVCSFALAHGAKACRISGAGGGGFMMIWCDPIDRFSLIKALKGLGVGEVTTVTFSDSGTQAWTIRDQFGVSL